MTTNPSASQKTFQIYYFASASSFTNKTHETLPAPLPIAQLFPLLEKRYPGITAKVLRSSSLSVGGEYIDTDLYINKGDGAEPRDVLQDGKMGRVIQPGEEVAVIPPVSSG
ncbi:hypothetical protein VTN49DRAFT_6276 [Thermomyces lanuginosus]|uniref:uncharacterized protein n=1 Tax=Thermomyces lanuginosus TaxID=5541 RepID=UPI00374481A2